MAPSPFSLICLLLLNDFIFYSLLLQLLLCCVAALILNRLIVHHPYYRLYFRFHYENMPMQYTEIFKVVKNENFQKKKNDIFLIFAQNIDCGYTLEPPLRGGSNEYPQSMFLSKNKKKRYTPAYPSFAI